MFLRDMSAVVRLCLKRDCAKLCRREKIVSIPDTKYLSDRAIAKLQGQHLQHAITDFNRVFDIDVYDFDGLYYRGSRWFQQRAFQNAIDDFTEALWIYSIYSLAYVFRGTSHFCLSFVQEAVEDYEVAMEGNSTCALPITSKALYWLTSTILKCLSETWSELLISLNYRVKWVIFPT